MATVRVSGGVGDLARDLVKIAKTAPVELRKVVSDDTRAGNRIARGFAKESAGRHGKLYWRAFTSEMHGRASSLGGGNLYEGEYGPDAALPQGDMSFEWGSQNQDPHLDLNRSADIIGPHMLTQTRGVVDRLFW